MRVGLFHTERMTGGVYVQAQEHDMKSGGAEGALEEGRQEAVLAQELMCAAPLLWRLADARAKAALLRFC